MASSKLPVGTAAYFNDLIAQATAELKLLQDQVPATYQRYKDWYDLVNANCHRKSGCSADDRSTQAESEQEYNTLTTNINNKAGELQGYKDSLKGVNITVENTNPNTAAETARKAKANQNWLIFGLTALVLLGIGAGIWWWRKTKQQG